MRRLVVFCALVLFAVPVHAEDLAGLVGQVCGKDDAVRSAAYQKLWRSPDPAVVPLLLEAMPAAPEMGQYYGALILQRLASDAARSALRKLAKGHGPHLRVVAAAALERMGERGLGKVIAKALATPDLAPAKRATLLMRLYSIREPEVQAAVRALLRKNESPQVLEVAIYDVYLVRDPQARAPLQGLLEHADAGVRALAAGCLMVLGEAQAAPDLAAAVESGPVGSGALYKLDSMLEQAQPVPAKVLEALCARLDAEKDVNALRAIVRMLGKLGYVKAAPRLRELLESDNALLSRDAFEALSHLPGGLSPDALRKLLTSGSEARQLAAADALRRADDASGFPVVVRVLASGKRVQDRWEAARVLAGFRTPSSVDALLTALADDNMTVRSNAYNSLVAVLAALFPYRRLDLATTGYVTTDPAARRAEALQRIRAWWSEHRTASR